MYHPQMAKLTALVSSPKLDIEACEVITKGEWHTLSVTAQPLNTFNSFTGNVLETHTTFHNKVANPKLLPSSLESDLQAILSHHQAFAAHGTRN